MEEVVWACVSIRILHVLWPGTECLYLGTHFHDVNDRTWVYVYGSTILCGHCTCSEWNMSIAVPRYSLTMTLSRYRDALRYILICELQYSSWQSTPDTCQHIDCNAAHYRGCSQMARWGKYSTFPEATWPPVGLLILTPNLWSKENWVVTNHLQILPWTSPSTTYHQQQRFVEVTVAHIASGCSCYSTGHHCKHRIRDWAIYHNVPVSNLTSMNSLEMVFNL